MTAGMFVRLWLAIAVAAGSAPAGGEVAGEEEPRPATEAPADEPGPIEELPAPTEASGLEVPPEEASRLWWIPRALLFVPRLALEVIDAPIRGGLYVSDRYQLIERAEDLLFNDARTFGVYPIGAYESGFGISAGAKMVHRDMFGRRESADLKALYGGRYTQEYSLELSTGDRFSRLRAGLETEIQRRPTERFFGIGNGDLVDASAIVTPIDPLESDVAVASRYRQDSVLARAELDLALGGHLFAAGRTGLERRELGRSDDPSGDAALADVYDPAAVVGFTEIVDTSYSELELRLDTRRPANRYASAAMPSRGVLVAGRAGYDREIGASRPGFFRFEADLQAYLDLYEGTRALGFRLLAVQIDAEADEVAFFKLPRLGGDTLLRGYQTDRFRDRGLLLATAEYKFELNPRYLAGFLFVDAGRVQRSILDPELGGLRVGFGGGLQLHSPTSFLMRLHVASSSDGGVFLNLDFDPVTGARVRN